MAPALPGVGHSIATSTANGFILVSTYSWTLITLGTVVTRFAQGVALRKVDMGLDDAAIVAASFFYLGATISWQYAIDGGLGKKLQDLSDGQITLLFKGFYIATVLGIVAMACAKLSATLLIDRVSPQTRRAKTILFSVLATWTVFALFAVAFECGVPQWNVRSMKCGHSGAVISVIATNIITDLMLTIWIIPTLWNLSLERELRILATILFGTRGFVPIVAGAQIWAASRVDRSNDPSDAFLGLALLTQAVTSMSLIVTSIPRIKRCLAIGGSPVAVAEVQPNEIPILRGRIKGRPPIVEPKLVPPDMGISMATITSENSRNKTKKQTPPKSSDWQGMISMGSKGDEHTSQSSLCDHDDHGGVMLQQEVVVSVEDRGIQRAP